MGSLYTIGTPKLKKKKWDLVIGALVILFIIGAYLLLRAENKSNSFTVDESNNAPQTSVVGVKGQQVTTIDNELFKLNLPGDWEEWKEEGGHSGGVYRYKALGFKDNGRSLEVYVNSLPKEEDLRMTYLLPIRPAQNGLSVDLGELSEHCKGFAPLDREDHTLNVIRAWWKEIEFDCDVQPYINIVGTASYDDSYLVPLGTKKDDQDRFFFHFTDHSSKPNNNVFTEIMRSFVAK